MINAPNIPPQAIEVEENILGSMLISPHRLSKAFELLRKEDFYKPAHRTLFRTMLDLYMANIPVDLLSVETKLSDNQQLDAVGGSGYISDLTRSGSGANLEYYAQIVKEKAMRRNIIDACSKVIANAYDSSTDTYDVIDQAQEAVFSVTRDEGSRTYDVSETMNAVVTEISDRLENGTPIGIKTGLDIDLILNGFQSEFYVIGARPSMGKTALTLTMMRNISRNGYKTGILSLETSHTSLGYRLLAMVSGLSVDAMKSGNLDQEQLNKVLSAANELSEHGIYLDDTLSLNAVQLRAKCRSMVQQYGVDIIFIDFLQLLSGEGDTREQEISKLSRTCKLISKELDIPIVALSQLSRATESRTDKRPMLSDLRESGAIEQDAYGVMFLYRPEYYGVERDEQGNSTSNICEVIIAKNKDGRTGTKKLFFYPEEMRFANLQGY